MPEGVVVYRVLQDGYTIGFERTVTEHLHLDRIEDGWKLGGLDGEKVRVTVPPRGIMSLKRQGFKDERHDIR